MTQKCQFCGNETAGVEPCPWCNASGGVGPVKPKIVPVVIHDEVKRSSNPWPVALMLLAILVVGVILTQRKRNTDEIQAAAHQPTNYVVSNSPLFKNGSSQPPQLAKTASIQASALPNTPAKSPKDPTEAANEADAEDAAVQDPASIVESRPVGIQLSDVQMASQNDGDGHEMALGSATLYNSSPYEVTNYDIYISASGGNYRLQPFSGSPDNPTPLTVRTIAPGARITVPVMTNGVYSSDDSGASKTVSVEAVENGVTVSSHVTIN